LAKVLKIRDVPEEELEMRKIINLSLDEHICKIRESEEKPEDPEDPDDPEDPEDPEPPQEKAILKIRNVQEEEQEEERDFLEYLKMMKNVPPDSKQGYIFNFINVVCTPNEYLNLLILAYVFENSNGDINNIGDIARNIQRKYPIYKELEVRKAVKNLKMVLPSHFF